MSSGLDEENRLETQSSRFKHKYLCCWRSVTRDFASYSCYAPCLFCYMLDREGELGNGENRSPESSEEMQFFACSPSRPAALRIEILARDDLRSSLFSG